MSRPIYEPNDQRTAARLNYGQEQLFRRPSRPSGVPGAEWARFTSTTNWTAGTTELDFGGGSGSWDTSFPTFNVNANSNMEIFKPGLYRMAFELLNVTISVGVTAEMNIEVAVIDGPVPDGGAVNGLATVGSYGWTSRQPYYVGDPDINSGAGFSLNWPEHTNNVFAYEDPWYPPDPTPAEFQVRGLRYEDGVSGFSDSNVVVRMWVVRYGYVWTE